jgi:glycerol uptake facilitator-like aquaporin
MRALHRRMLAEFFGSALLVCAVVGSGIMAARLSPGDVGLQLLENSIATMLALAVLILIFSPVSGGHFNPIVSAVEWWLHRRSTNRLRLTALLGYLVAQTAGAILGTVLANTMFALAPVTWSTTTRSDAHLWIGEIVATGGLVLLILALVRTGRTRIAAPAVGAYIGAAYWFTSSTSFANPAVTIGRAFTDTFAGIAPASVPGFILAQVTGASIGAALVLLLYPVPLPASIDAAVEPAMPAQSVRSVQ